MKNKKLIIAAVLIILIQTASAAWFIPWIKENQQPIKDERFTNLYNQVISPMNTMQNINLVTPYMNEYGYRAIKVHVTDYNKDFYVLSGQGTTLTPPARVDKTYSLNSNQVSRGAAMIKDGKIDTFEQWQLILMLRWA